MDKFYFAIYEATTNEAWYNNNFVNTLLGALFTLLGTFIGLYFSEKNRKIDERKNMIILIYQSDSELFHEIYKESKNIGSIDHTKMRSLLKSFNLIYLLPKKLKNEFEELYSIYLLSGNDFINRKNNIHSHCVNIIKYINVYGDGIFG